MKLPPYIYEPDKSIETFEETIIYLESHAETKDRIQNLGWIYHEVGKIIPQTTENYWSGHYFPFSESWDDLQISSTQCFFGLYKQAFVSLRSGLELGLLSVYYNINDDGHKTVADWYASLDSPDSHTPRSDKIWKILLSNKNIDAFNKQYDLRKKFANLNYLHNYVHTKGHKFSNSLGGLIGRNSQVFVAKALEDWLSAYEQIIVLIAAMHLLKYPIAVIDFDYFKKFGIDNPNFGGLERSKIQKIASILPAGYMQSIKEIATADRATQNVLKQISTLPDKTDAEIEKQALDVYKMGIEHGEGFISWEQQQYKFMEDIITLYPEKDHSDFKKITFQRIEILKAWSIENSFLESKSKRFGWDKSL